MTPRERLNEILNARVTDFLEKEGFKFNANKSQYTKTINKIKQIIYFEGSKWNYADAVADYQLHCRLEIKLFPKWYIENYNTNQATHHQRKITPKSIHQPSPSKRYTDNWDDFGQINGKYDLVKFSKNEIEENVFVNIKKCILPYLQESSTYSGIAEKAIIPLDSFDFYMMDNKTVEAKKILEKLILKIKSMNVKELDASDDFSRKSLENTVNMLNIRINHFFPELGNMNMKN